MSGSLVDLSKEFYNDYKWSDLVSLVEEDIRGGYWGGFSSIDISLDGEVIVLGSSNLPGEGGYYGYDPAGEIQIYKLVDNQLQKLGGRILGEAGRDFFDWRGVVDTVEQIGGGQFSLSGNGEVLAVIGRGANNPTTGEKDDGRISIYKISDKGWVKTATIWGSDYNNILFEASDIDLNYEGDLIYISSGHVGGWVDVFINNDENWHKFTHTKGDAYDYSTSFRNDTYPVNTLQIQVSGDGKTLAIKGNSATHESFYTRPNGVKVYRIENPNISAIGSAPGAPDGKYGFELDFSELGQTIDPMYFESGLDSNYSFDSLSGWRTSFALSNDGNRIAISEAGLSGLGVDDATRIFELENDNWVEMNYENQVKYSRYLSFSSDGEKLLSGQFAYKLVDDQWEQIANAVDTDSYEGRYSSLGNSIISPNGEYSAHLVRGVAQNLDYDTLYYSADTSSSAYPGAVYLYNLLGNETIKPTILGPSENTINVSENQNSIYTFTADETVSWSLIGGIDISQFIINSSSGALSFVSAPDYETPTDSDLDNTYEIVVRATDLVGNVSDQEITVNVDNIEGSVISVNQTQYQMVREEVTSFQDIYISAGKETAEGDIYIIPFIPNNYYWFATEQAKNRDSWTFELGNIDPEDMILIDYPIGDLISGQIDQLWDTSKIFEAANCIWIDGYYVGDPLESNGYEFETLFSDGFTAFGYHPESIELASGDFDSFKSSQFGLIDLSKLDLKTITDLSASQFKNNFSNMITPGDKHGETTNGDDSNESITGTNLYDNIFGLGGDDKIIGRNGFDNLFGGSGDDSLYGGKGNDTIAGGTGADIIYGDSAADSLYGDKGNDTIYGGTGADIIYGGNGDDSLNGDSAVDTLYGDAGDDTLRGGKGSDTLSGGEGVDIIFGNTGDDKIYGGEDADTISGGGGNDEINGDSGDDTITGGDGADKLYGGKGDDSLKGDFAVDIIYGDAGDDTLRGGKGADTLSGGIGSDTIYGNTGDDTINGGADKDTISGGGGNDLIKGDSGNDLIKGGSGLDNLFGNLGADKLYGDSAADSLYGDNGDDKIYGGTGADKLYGGKGDDSLYGDSAFDELYGNTGDDTLRGGKGSDTLSGGTGADTIFGNTGDDIIYGGADADIISGGSGYDTIYGGSGDDRITGGGGNDIFQIGTGDGRDLITDYKSGTDSIELLGNLTKNNLTFSYAGGNTSITYNDDLLAIVENISSASDITFI